MTISRVKLYEFLSRDEGISDNEDNQVITNKVFRIQKKDTLGVYGGQKTKSKARLAAQGFHEPLKPQSNSPTASKESFKL